MTITGIIVLAVIILAFLTFALALAWGERQTRNISRGYPKYSRATAQARSFKKIVEDLDRSAPIDEKVTYPTPAITDVG